MRNEISQRYSLIIATFNNKLILTYRMSFLHFRAFALGKRKKTFECKIAIGKPVLPIFSDKFRQQG